MSNIRKGWGDQITVETEVEIDIDDILAEIGKERVIKWVRHFSDTSVFDIDDSPHPEDTAKLIATHIWREDDRKRFIEKFKEITGVL